MARASKPRQLYKAGVEAPTRTKVLLSVAAWELAQIDELASAANMSRSEYMVASALTRRRDAQLMMQVEKLRNDVSYLAGLMEDRRQPEGFRQLQEAATNLLNFLHRKDVPDDVQEAIRKVLVAGKVVW